MNDNICSNVKANRGDQVAIEHRNKLCNKKEDDSTVKYITELSKVVSLLNNLNKLDEIDTVEEDNNDNNDNDDESDENVLTRNLAQQNYDKLDLESDDDDELDKQFEKEVAKEDEQQRLEDAQKEAAMKLIVMEKKKQKGLKAKFDSSQKELKKMFSLNNDYLKKYIDYNYLYYENKNISNKSFQLITDISNMKFEVSESTSVFPEKADKVFQFVDHLRGAPKNFEIYESHCLHQNKALPNEKIEKEVKNVSKLKRNTEKEIKDAEIELEDIIDSVSKDRVSDKK